MFLFYRCHWSFSENHNTVTLCSKDKNMSAPMLLCSPNCSPHLYCCITTCIHFSHVGLKNKKAMLPTAVCWHQLLSSLSKHTLKGDQMALPVCSPPDRHDIGETKCLKMNFTSFRIHIHNKSKSIDLWIAHDTERYHRNHHERRAKTKACADAQS